ncbi:MAG: two-component system response regulator CreB [Proteobacteria bacterium]|nr:two-component system response regulator CreB [Pseudomonadota bacterium]
MTPILLLEDDAAIAATIAYALAREGYAVTQAMLVREAEQRLAATPPALAIFDVGLPDGSGLDLLRRLREQGSRLPVLMLTARAEEFDRVLGLELGADDYLTKPFSPRELVARVRALLRRAAHTPPVAPSAFELDEAGQRIRYAGTWLTLTRLEYGLLRTLLRAPMRIHSRDALLDAAWGHQAESVDRTVDTHIKTLRAKLRHCTPGHDPIVTHRGMGYSLTA